MAEHHSTQETPPRVYTQGSPSTYKKRAIPNRVRREVCEAAGARIGTTVVVRCAYCPTTGKVHWSEEYAYWPTVSGLEFDHIIPEFLGGASTAENIRLACRSCNRAKGWRW